MTEALLIGNQLGEISWPILLKISQHWTVKMIIAYGLRPLTARENTVFTKLSVGSWTVVTNKSGLRTKSCRSVNCLLLKVCVCV